MMNFVAPGTNVRLVARGDDLVREDTGELVGRVIGGIPRFVDLDRTYAESFGWQWKKWESDRSDTRNPGFNAREVVLNRTHFAEYDLRGKTILECGMGGGDDTEVLLQLPFAEVHSFDLSTAVERAHKFLKDTRLVLSQASIFDIPYADRSFDIVYCHRVLQHTPDPTAALQTICRKVKSGGLLFAHAYKRSFLYMMEWRYKYRWLTKRMSWNALYEYVDRWGPSLHGLTQAMYRWLPTKALAYNFLPWFYVDPRHFPAMNGQQILDMARHITFDALTPWHDHPMTSRAFFGTIEAEGFRIEHRFDPTVTPMWCTARKL